MRPDDVAVPAHHGMRRSVFDGFIREQRRVNASEYHPGPTSTHLASNLVPTPRIPRVDANPHHIARLDGVHIEPLQRLVHDPWISPATSGGGSQDVQPARRNHGHAERLCARIDEMDPRHALYSLDNETGSAA